MMRNQSKNASLAGHSLLYARETRLLVLSLPVRFLASRAAIRDHPARARLQLLDSEPFLASTAHHHVYSMFVSGFLHHSPRSLVIFNAGRLEKVFGNNHPGDSGLEAT